MNIKNIDRLIAFFEDGAPHFTLDMSTGITIARTDRRKPLTPGNCKTAGCIAGLCWQWYWEDKEGPHAAMDMLAGRSFGPDGYTEDIAWPFVQSCALKFLGLDPQIGRGKRRHIEHELFLGPDNPETPVSPQMAIIALTRLKNGETDLWRS